MRSGDAELIFDLSEGRLEFREGDLDLLAEHLAWCYRLMGVRQGSVIAVQDFGSSPLAFLGSALLMPTLNEGIAERFGARFICLDGSAERVTLTPAILAQLAVDVLVVRADVADLLAETIERAGVKLGRTCTIAAFRDDEPPPRRFVPWRYLLHVESALLLAPECPVCGCFHLHHDFYALEAGVVRNLRIAGAGAHRLRGAETLSRGHCALGPDDFCIRYPLRAATR